MRSIFLASISGMMNERIFNRSLFIYFMFSSLLSIIGFSETQYSSLIFMWQVASLVMLSIYLIFKHRYLTRVSSKYVLLLISYFIVQILIMLGTSFTEQTLVFSIGTQLVPIIYLIVFFIVLGRFSMSSINLAKFNLGYIVFALFASIYNFIINIDSLTSFFSVQNPYDLMFSSFFTNRNTFGFILAVALIALIFNWSKLLTIKMKLFYSISAIILGASLVLTMSRGSLVLLFIFIFLYTLLYRGFSGMLKIIFLISVGILAVISLIGFDFIIDNIIRPEYGSSGRDGIQEFGIAYFLEHNVFLGSGYTSPVDAVFDKFGYTSFHSIYVTVLATGGLVLAALYSIFMVSSFRTMLRIYFINKKTGAFFIAIFIAYLIYGFIESTLPLRLGMASLIVSLYILFLPIYLDNFFRQKPEAKL